jgi:hypothetical protein
MIYNHRESRWNDIDREKLLTRQPDLSDKLSAVHWKQVEGMGENKEYISLGIISVHTCM